MAGTPAWPALGSALAKRRATWLRLRRCRCRLGELGVLSQPLLKSGVSEPAPGGWWGRAMAQGWVGAAADAWPAGQERDGAEKRTAGAADRPRCSGHW